MEKGSNRMNIDFYPVNEAAKLFPPKPIKFELPSWYKNLSTFVGKYDSKENYLNVNLGGDVKSLTPFTVKKCIPVLDYLTSGYIFYTSSDIFIRQNTDEHGVKGFNWQTPDVDSGLIDIHSSHPHSQCPVSIGGTRYHYIKFGLSWRIKTPPGYSCLVYQPNYNFEEKFRLFPAIIDTDSFDSTFNIPGYVLHPEPFLLKAGSPLVTIFPFKRDEWKMNIKDDVYHNNQVSSFFKISRNKFFEVYRDFFHNKKKYD